MAVDDLAALRRNVDQLPKLVTEKLRAVAFRKSREVQARAQQILASKVRLSGKHLHEIVVIEQADRKQFLVEVESDPKNLGWWIERGTVHMAARPFLRPAADEVEPSYKSEMVKAAEDVMGNALGATK